MQLRELKSFCVTAEVRSMSKAADLLDIGQPTVSTHIQRLEEELGMVLFDRYKRPIQPTLAGAALARLAGPLVEGIEGLKASTAEAERHGPVSVASTPDIIPHTLLKLVTAYRQEYPEVHLQIRSGHRPDILRMVKDGEVDLGMVPGADTGPDCDFQPLFPYERVLITPLRHPLLEGDLTLERISQYDLVLMGPSTHTHAMLAAEMRRRGLRHHVVVELDSMDMIKRYVALGMGVSVGPRLAIEPEDEERLGVVSLATLLPVEQAGIVTQPGKVLSNPAQDFIDQVLRVTGAPRFVP
jgi:DNA-binding transcriptional LysR family regulator